MFQQRIPQQLIVSVMTYRELPSSIGHTFDQRGGTLGRAPECDLVLEDESKTISRIHARADFRDGHFMLLCLGTNPIHIGERMIATGEAITLDHGQQIHLGDYHLAVEIIYSPATHVNLNLNESSPVRAVSQVDESASTTSFGLNLFGGVMSAIDQPPLLELSAQHGHAQEGGMSPKSGQKRSMAIPADYDPLADVHALSPPPPPSLPKKSTAPAHTNEVLAALMEGMGLAQMSTSMSPVDVARLAGIMLRELTTGTMAACVTRSLTKSETQLDVTMLKGRANNPLKFSPTAELALAQFFSSSDGAYLPPELAIQGVFDDLRAHELAMIASSRAAMSEILRQISPTEIEQQLKNAGDLDHVFQSQRKARCWDGLIQRYAALDVHSDEDAQRWYARQFSLAYAQQIAGINKKKIVSK